MDWLTGNDCAQATDFPDENLFVWEKEPEKEQPEKLERAKLWNDERKWMEELANKRVTFLVTLFGFVLAGLIALKAPIPCLILLAIGLVLCFLVTKSVHRGYAVTRFYTAKMEAAGYMVVKAKAAAFDPKAKANWYRGKSSFGYLARGIPNLVCLILALMTAYCIFAVLHIWSWPLDSTLPTSAAVVGENGKDGRDGRDGAPGRDGRDGKNGRDGRDTK